MSISIDNLRLKLAGGVTPAMVTPLQPDGYTVDTAALPRLVDFLIERKVKGLFIGGTTGEGLLLDVSERRRLHEAALAAVNGRVPVLLHVGDNRTDTTIALARHAAEIGADAVVAITPTFFGMNEDSLAVYFQTLADAVPATPLLLYDIPHLAINGISPALLARLAQTIPTLAGLKSSRPDAQIVRQLIDAAPEQLLVLAGNESIALGLLALGAHGLISGLSTAVPEPFVALTAAYTAGNMVEAQRQQRKINRLLALLPAGARIAALKHILAERGVPVGPAVPPHLAPPDLRLWPRLAAILED